MLSPILADFGGIGVLFLLAVLIGSVVVSVGLALFDRRPFQFVLAATSCLLFCAFCIVFGLAVFAFLLRGRSSSFPTFVLLIPPITAIQFIFYCFKRSQTSNQALERTGSRRDV